MRRVMLAGFLAFAYALPESVGTAELKRETTKQLSPKFFLIAATSGPVQNEGHSAEILPIQERSLCAPQKS
jgi:hypothetical protein